MEELKSLIQQVDDDYLVGLSNKGTVKRACKDLEQEQPEVVWQESEAQVSLKEETCVIRAPLGESGCSCPSRSICRHVVTAILWLKKSLAETENPQADGEPSSSRKQEDGESPSSRKQADGEPSSGGLQADGESQPGKTDGQKQPGEPEVSPQPEAATSQKTATPKVLEEVLQMPLPKLKRACGNSRFRQFLSRMRAGELPPVEESSIVAVQLPWENVTVKLLEPFAYSACSCHSKELCTHKAQAVLVYQLYKGKTAFKDLEALQEEEKIWDEEQVHKASVRVREVICHQINVGLSRNSQEASDELERLAVIAHRASLPQLESWLREAASMYEQYARRSAAFRSEELLRRLLRLYTRAGSLLQAESQKRIRTLAGKFRDTYELAGDLHLMGIGVREFHSKTGYEGEIYYFLETRQGAWYTWTDARPVFYEKTKRRPVSSLEKASAPWGLPCNREEMLHLEFQLKDAKAASGGRLSVSQETKSEIIGSRDLSSDAFENTIVWDYEKLAEQYFVSYQEQDTEGRREHLALVGAVRWGETSFDTVSQRFSWSLYDEEGRTVFISLRYTKEEKAVIRLLERLEQRLKKQEQEYLLFFGFLYLDEEGRMCLYPIEFFQTKTAMPVKTETVPKKHPKLPEPEVWKTLEQYQREAMEQLNDLFVSGLHSVQDASVERMAELSEEGERLGLHQAGNAFGGISKLLQEKRHQMEFEPEPIVEAMAGLYRYLTVCGEKISHDRVLLTMREERTHESE